MSKTSYNELDFVCALDLETSGLDEQGDQVLEVAMRLGRLTPSGWDPASRPFLPCMATTTGCQAVTARKTAENLGLEQCDQALLASLEYFPHTEAAAAKFTLLGNSVHFDLRFVRRLFPKFAKRLSHRVIDVSAISLFCQSLGMPKPEGAPAHRAMADVDESLRLLASFRKWIRDSGYEGGAS